MLYSTVREFADLVMRCVCGLTLAAVWVSSAAGQNALPSGYRAHAVQHREASDLAPQLRTMLSGLGDEIQVLVDQESNRLIVKGPEQAQQVAAQMVTALDRPASTNAAADITASRPVARGYETAWKKPVEVAQGLRNQFPSARVEADSRTGQVVVLAPESVQRQVAAVLGQVKPFPAAPALNAISGSHRLQHISWREFEDQLRLMWGSRMGLSTTRNGELAAIALASPQGPQPVMRIDRRANQVDFEGTPRQAQVWQQVVRTLDRPLRRDEQTQLVTLLNADPSKVQQAVALVQPAVPPPENQPAPAQPQAPPAAAVPLRPNDEDAADAADAEGSGLIGPVQIEFLEGLDALIIRGHKRDIERVRKIIEDIERISQETQPVIEIYPLEHVNSEAVTALVTELYTEILSPRQGQVSIRALVEPNSILLIGREESLAIIRDLLEKLDKPTAPTSRFEVLHLKHLSALDAETAVRNFFVNKPGTDTLERPGLGARVKVIADYRMNALIVQASPRDLTEVRRLIESLDTENPATSAQVRVFRLRNALAVDLATVLQTAIRGDGTTTGQQQVAGQGGGTQAGSRLPSTSLEFMMLDQAGGRLLKSGVVADVQVSADENTNALIVRAPAKSMDLIEALIKELDQMPDAEAQLKVFTIVNGDATSLAATLQQVFGQSVTIGQGTGGALGIAFRQPTVQTTTTGGENSLVPLTFAEDVRTNSVIVSGSASDLEVVETLLLRLDETGFTTNQIIVYRLKNNDSASVAQTLTSYVQAQQQTLNLTVNSGLSTTLDQLVLQTTVISEPISNSVIVAASPRYIESILQAIRDLDIRPPMVMVQVLIAEVALSDVFEMGIELGIQDSLLFDRGIAGGPDLVPGFNFNNVGLPNENTQGAGTLAGQGVAALGVGRTAALGSGPGGMILSAASDSINILIRALEEEGRLQVLSRPQVMALNNQPAFVQVGRDISRITGTTVTNNGVTQSVVDIPTGLILSIQPRINDDGVVVMTVDADKSELGAIADGTQLSDGAGGVIVARPIDRTTAQTTISAKSGQTVVIGGLITNRDELQTRGVPFLRNIPVMGKLFEFEARLHRRTELLIVLTPYIISEDEDYEMVKVIESQRMNWCLGDVVSLDGDRGLDGAGCLFCSNNVPVLFPDHDPTGIRFSTEQHLHSHAHSHESPQPTPAVLPNDQAQGLQRSGLGQQPSLERLPPQTMSTGYYQPGQPVYQADPTYGAAPASYVPNQPQAVNAPTNPPARTGFQPSWFPFRRQQ